MMVSPRPGWSLQGCNKNTNSKFWYVFFFFFLFFIYFTVLCWGLTSQSTIFQSCRDGATTSWVINQYFRGVKCLAQGHNTAAVGFEPRTSRSGVRHYHWATALPYFTVSYFKNEYEATSLTCTCSLPLVELLISIFWRVVQGVYFVSPCTFSVSPIFPLPAALPAPVISRRLLCFSAQAISLPPISTQLNSTLFANHIWIHEMRP